MRLIDADELVEYLKKYHSMSQGVISDVEHFPTSIDTDKLAEKVEHIIEFEFNWLRAIMDEEGRITYGSLDIAEQGIKKIVRMIKVGEQDD